MILLLLTACLLSAAAVAADGARRPNIIFLLADDLGYADIGAYGQKKIRTPNLDQLARDGMKFTQAYSGHNVCAPSRCVLMTGLHPGHAYIRNNRGGMGVGSTTEGQEPVPAGEQVKLPDTIETYLPTVAEEKAAKDKGKEKKKPNKKQPEFVGPRGHQEPPKN